MPSEHGGWGLTIEPGLLGLLVAPSWAGLCLALAAVTAFLARTPVKLVLVDLHRDRRLPRTRLAARVALAEVVIIAVLGAIAVLTATDNGWWLPLLVAAPLLAIELWFDMRSRSRRLLPELAGAVAIAAVAASVTIAGGETGRLALGVWAILGARALTSIPHVRNQIMKLHHRPTTALSTIGGDVGAIVVATMAVILDTRLAAGAGAIAAVIVFQRISERLPAKPPKVVGIRQMVIGFAVVAVTAVGVILG